MFQRIGSSSAVTGLPASSGHVRKKATRGSAYRFYVAACVVAFILIALATLRSRSHHRKPLVADDINKLRRYQYFIAANFYNNDDILPQFNHQLLKLIKVLGHSNVFVSMYESASRDGTKKLLQDLHSQLLQQHVPHTLELDDSGGWRSLCGDLPEGFCERAECTSLRDCGEHVRIPIMAAIRNRALRPLLKHQKVKVNQSPGRKTPDIGKHTSYFYYGGGAPYAGGVTQHEADVTAQVRYKPTDSTKVIFLNDVLLWSADIVELLLTNDMKYDMACAMDFELFRFYDQWVARDINGGPFLTAYPYVSEPKSQALLMQNKPFPVYSCWNGAVVFDAAPIVDLGIAFRSWEPGEALSLHPDGDPEKVFYFVSKSDKCAASECHLICKDFWAANHTAILMNPKVKLYYNRLTYFVHSYIMPVINTITAWLHVPQQHKIPHRLITGRFAHNGRHAGQEPSESIPPGSTGGGGYEASQEGRTMHQRMHRAIDSPQQTYPPRILPDHAYPGAASAMAAEKRYHRGNYLPGHAAMRDQSKRVDPAWGEGWRNRLRPDRTLEVDNIWELREPPVDVACGLDGYSKRYDERRFEQDEGYLQ